MSMKNPLTPAGIELATFRFVAQPCTMGNEGKVVRAWHGVDHPPVSSSTEVKEKEELYIYSTSTPHLCLYDKL